jgi:hypothetical protein
MSSSNKTLGSNSRDIECDNTERTNSLNIPGGLLTNRAKNGLTIWINENAGTVDNTDGNATSIPIGPGASYRLPHTCHAFTSRCFDGTEFLIYSRD